MDDYITSKEFEGFWLEVTPGDRLSGAEFTPSSSRLLGCLHTVLKYLTRENDEDKICKIHYQRAWTQSIP